MTDLAIELPRRDRDHLHQIENRETSREGILNWMGRHKTLTTLGIAGLLATTVALTPGGMEWCAKYLQELYTGASKKVQEWLQTLQTFLYERIVPENVRNAVSSGAAALDNAKKTAGAVVEEGQRVVRDADLIRKAPGASAKAFGWTLLNPFEYARQFQETYPWFSRR